MCAGSKWSKLGIDFSICVKSIPEQINAPKAVPIEQADTLMISMLFSRSFWTAPIIEEGRLTINNE